MCAVLWLSKLQLTMAAVVGVVFYFGVVACFFFCPRVERFPDLQAEKEQRDKEERHVAKMKMLGEKDKLKADLDAKKKLAEDRMYLALADSDNMTGNSGNNEDLEDDFM